MGWTAYILLIFGFASLFFVAAAFALNWAHRNGQLEHLDAGAASIFDEDEPLGEQTDYFPGKGGKSPISKN